MVRDLAPRIIEGIWPDRGLERAKAKWSKEVRGLSVEQELGSEIIIECQPNGELAPAREAIQEAHAPHGDWENVAPQGVRFALRLAGQNAWVREDLLQMLQRRAIYWLGRFPLSRPKSHSSTIVCSLPGSPIFENPFYGTSDPRREVLEPYFKFIEEFTELDAEYPNLKINWKAAFPVWSIWPMAQRFVGKDKRLPAAPGGELHLKQSAARAAAELLGFRAGFTDESAKRWLNPGRDRWLNISALPPWQYWLYAIREFWLRQAEEAEASGANVKDFEKMADENGYLAGHSTPIGQRIWSVMVARQMSLRDAMKDLGFSTGQELGSYKDPAAWIQDGVINHAFHAFVYFCRVLAARRLLELKAPGPICLDSRLNERGAVALFTRKLLVTVIRAAETPNETRWQTYAGGDLENTALFEPADRLVTGDEIHCDIFDEPRVIVGVTPVLAGVDVHYWKAVIYPKSSRVAQAALKARQTDPRHAPMQQSLAGPGDMTGGSAREASPEESAQKGSDQLVSKPSEVAGTPEERLSRFMREHTIATYADIKYSANVHTAEFQDWRKEKLKPTSVMSVRIENVLNGSTPLQKKSPKQRKG